MALLVHSSSAPATTAVSEGSPTDPSHHRVLSASPYCVSSSPNYVHLSQDRAQDSDETQQSQDCMLLSKPSCCRNLIHTFQNEASRQQLSKSGYKSKVSRTASTTVFERLSDHRPQKPSYYDENLTFCPKLNPVSIRLVREKTEKSSKKQSSVKSTICNYTFKPTISERSLHLAQNMEAGFHTRQQRHLLRRQKFVSFTCIV